MKLKLSYFLLFVMSLSHFGCDGTEVGNGRTRPEPPQIQPDVSEGSPDDALGGEDKGESGGKTPDEASESDSPPNDELLMPYLFASCASPFAEARAGKWVDADAGTSIVVTEKSSGVWTIVVGSKSSTVAPEPTSSNPYGVEVDPAPSSTTPLSCSDIETNGSTRTITFSDTAELSWTVDSNGFTGDISLKKGVTLLRNYTFTSALADEP